MTLDKVIDLSSGLTFALISISGFMIHRDQTKTSCATNSATNSAKECVTACSVEKCPISACSRANAKLATYSSIVSASLYLYRGITS